MKKQITPLLVFFLFVSNLLLKAQQGDTIEIQYNRDHQITFARFKPDTNMKMTDGAAFLSKVLSTKSGHEFRLLKETTDEQGIIHQRYVQYWKGIRIDNEEYLIHGKNGVVETINGESPEIDLNNASPRLNEKTAMENALTYVNAKKYKWQDDGMEKWIKENTQNKDATYYPKGELVIAKSNLKSDARYFLSWKFTISSLEPNDEQLIYVDAIQGSVIADISLICNTNITCTAQTRYSGQQNIKGDTYPDGIRLFETKNTTSGHTAIISTKNIQNGSNYASAVEFNNSTVNYTVGNWTTFNQNQSALDVHWGIENVMNYWSTVRQRNSINDGGMMVTSYIHYNPSAGSPGGWNNAQWDGGSHVMRFGDGDNSLFYPLVALDVTAHELGHGICQYTANLQSSGESASLNEGLSDIWGAVVEHWVSPDKQTWLMGEEIIASTGYNCLRDLQNPKSTTAAEGQHPNAYLGQYWSSIGEPHTNSTVLSHWFYLLSVGGCGYIDDNANNGAFAVYGITMDKAASIVYKAESYYLTSSANYSTARTATINAAIDIFGSSSNEVAQVTNAWYSVGVGTAYTGSASPIVGSFVPVCTTSTFIINGLPAGSTVTWSSSNPSGLSINSSTGVATRQNNFNGAVTISATVNSACGNKVVSRAIQVGIFTQLQVTVSTASGNGAVCPGNWYDYYANVLGGHQPGYTYQWSWPSNWYFQSQWSNRLTLSPPMYTPVGGGIVSVNVNNGCGTTTPPSGITVYQGYGCYTYSYSVSPNPVENVLTVVATVTVSTDTEEEKALQGISPEFNVELMASDGQKLLTQRSAGGIAKIDTKALRKGLYFIKIIDNNTVTTQRVMLK